MAKSITCKIELTEEGKPPMKCSIASAARYPSTLYRSLVDAVLLEQTQTLSEDALLRSASGPQTEETPGQ